MIPDRYDQVKHWLMRQFPDCHDVEVMTHKDAASLLPPGTAISPYVTGEVVVLFRVVEEDRAPPWKELAIAKPVLTGTDPREVLRLLDREQVARRLRVSPERRLLLDRRLQVEILGTTWTKGEGSRATVRER